MWLPHEETPLVCGIRAQIIASSVGAPPGETRWGIRTGPDAPRRSSNGHAWAVEQRTRLGGRRTGPTTRTEWAFTQTAPQAVKLSAQWNLAPGGTPVPLTRYGPSLTYGSASLSWSSNPKRLRQAHWAHSHYATGHNRRRRYNLVYLYFTLLRYE